MAQTLKQGDLVEGGVVNFDTQTGRKLEQGQFSTPVGSKFDVNTGVAINSDILNNDVKPMTITEPAPSTGNVGLGATIESGTNTSIQQANDQAKIDAQNKTNLASQTGFEESKKSYLDKLLGRKSKSELIAEENKTVNELGTTVNETAAAVRKINTEITSEQYALKKQKENLEKTFRGTKEGFAEAVAILEKNSVSKQADLYIKKLALDADYESAKDIANQSVDAKYEKETNAILAAELTFKENKELFTKEETRQYEEKIAKDKSELETKKENEKRTKDLKVEMLKLLNEQGAPQSYKDAVSRATTDEEIVNAAGVYAGDIQDRQIKQAQLEKTKAEQKITSLPPAIQTRVQTIANQFDNEQAVKSYQISAEAIDALNTAGTSPTDDQSRIYAFAKVMDPNSVVRESEYKTVQDYSMALFQKAGFKAKRVFANTGFLTDEARGFMKQTLENRLASSRKAYDNIYSEYGRRINKITGQTDGTDYVTDYSRAFTKPQAGGNIITAPDGQQIEIID